AAARRAWGGVAGAHAGADAGPRLRAHPRRADGQAPAGGRPDGQPRSRRPSFCFSALTKRPGAATGSRQSSKETDMIPKPHRASIVFYVADIVRTEAFYTETLGIELTR